MIKENSHKHDDDDDYDIDESDDVNDEDYVYDSEDESDSECYRLRPGFRTKLENTDSEFFTEGLFYSST